MNWLNNLLGKLFKTKVEEKQEDSAGFTEFKDDKSVSKQSLPPMPKPEPQKTHHLETVTKEAVEKDELKELNKSFVEMSDKFVDVLKEKFELELGYKNSDIEKLEKFMQDNENFFEKELKSDKKKLLPMMYAYVGEVVRRNNKGSWKKPSAKQSAVEINSDGEPTLVYPGTIIKQRIEKKTSLPQLTRFS